MLDCLPAKEFVVYGSEPELEKALIAPEAGDDERHHRTTHHAASPCLLLPELLHFGA